MSSARAVMARGLLSRAVVAYGLLGLAALVVGLELGRPFHGAGMAFDSQVSVLHFDRLIQGRQFEGFTTTTANPLLTAVYGSLHHVTAGWHAVSYAAIAAYATGVMAVAVLAGRLAGPIATRFAGVGTLMAAHPLFDRRTGPRERPLGQS
jgi:hypothetical protein